MSGETTVHARHPDAPEGTGTVFKPLTDPMEFAPVNPLKTPVPSPSRTDSKTIDI